MKIVAQRVKHADLYVSDKLVSSICKGIVIYVGVQREDTEIDARNLAQKTSKLRIFPNENDKLDFSVKDLNYDVLVVSQFTLLANCSKGNRPDFVNAEAPERANELYMLFGKCLEEYGINVQYGVFGADMTIKQINDGPLTLVLDTHA